jgi:hypothetical protein
MGKITIFGAGYASLPALNLLPPLLTLPANSICGLSTAAILTCPKPDDPDWKPHQITIVARDLPGDEPSQDWASPWYVKTNTPRPSPEDHLGRQQSIHPPTHTPLIHTVHLSPVSLIPPRRPRRPTNSIPFHPQPSTTAAAP